MRPTTVTRDAFDRLAAHDAEALISIYLPTHIKGAETAQDRIRLKNGIGEVDTWLERAGWKPRRRRDHLAECNSLLEDAEFWRHQLSGLAVFVDEKGEMAPVGLPEGTDARQTVTSSFHLRPMIASLELAETQVLVLTMGAVRIYGASRYEIGRIDADLPESFDDVNWFVDREKQRQQHPDRAGAQRGRHGHEPAQQRHEDLERFLRSVAESLPAFSDEMPLVVLGDDNLVARFASNYDEEVTTPPHSGIQDADDVGEVHGKARQAIESLEAQRDGERLDFASSRLQSGDAITDLEEGLAAAVSGRLSDLILHRHAPPEWGQFDAASLGISRHEGQGLFDVDLLDRLVFNAIQTGAAVSTTDDPIDGLAFVGVPRF